MQSSAALTVLEQAGSGQWGLVTTAQAEALGVSRVTLSRLQDRGALQRARYGVYALPSAGYGRLQDLQAAWLSTNASAFVHERIDEENGAVVSHLSAAHVHGLGDVIPMAHEFSLDARHQTSQKDLRFHRRHVPPEDRVIVDGLAVTSVARTVEDLVDGGRLDFDHLATTVRDALSHAEVTVSRLASRLGAAAWRLGFDDGLGLVHACLDQAGLPAVAANFASAARAAGGAAVPKLAASAPDAETLASALAPVLDAFAEQQRAAFAEMMEEAVREMRFIVQGREQAPSTETHASTAEKRNA